MKVALIPTGRTEWFGLARALGRLFTEHEFYCLPAHAEFASVGPYHGFTSRELSADSEATPPEGAQELVGRAAQEALGDRGSPAADMVVVVEDLELFNAHQPQRVVSVMRRAVEKHLRELPGRTPVRTEQRTRAVLRAKVSFHLIAPMIEAWFFADDGALRVAGVPAATHVDFAADTDPEVFETKDSAYLAASEDDCSELSKLPERKRRNKRPKWLGSLPRARHPKGYLQWLCIDPTQRSCTNYKESEHGARALTEIRWDALLARAHGQFGFLHALIEDLNDGLDCPEPTCADARVNPITARSTAPRNAVLRNI